MAKAKLELKKWLMEDMGFTEQEIADQKLMDVFASRLDKLDAGYLRQSDYDRVMNENKTAITAQQTELQAAQQRLDAEVAEWATVQANGTKVTEQMRQDLEAAQNDVLRFQQVLRKTAESTGLKYDDLVKGIEVKTVVPPPTTTPAIDTSKFVDRTQYDALTRMALLVPAQLDRIQREHFELTGEYVNPEEIVAEVQTRASTKGNQKSLELRDVWEEKYGIPAKRQEKATKEHAAEITAAEQRGAERALSEQHLPMGSTAQTGHHAPIFRQEHKSVLERPQAGLPNQGAVAALRTGKYRTPAQGAPAAK